MRRLPICLLAVGLLLSSAGRPSKGDEATRLAKLIDEHVQTRLHAEGLRGAPPADDAEFLRRAYLDLHGVVPTAERAAQFLDSSAPAKRAELIDELLSSPRYGEHFGDLW